MLNLMEIDHATIMLKSKICEFLIFFREFHAFLVDNFVQLQNDSFHYG